MEKLLAVGGKSLPWPLPANAGEQQPTNANPKKAKVFRGSLPPHPAADHFIHGLLTPPEAAANRSRTRDGFGGWWREHGIGVGGHGKRRHHPNRHAARRPDPHFAVRAGPKCPPAGPQPVAAQRNAGISFNWGLKARQRDPATVTKEREHFDGRSRRRTQAGNHDGNGHAVPRKPTASAVPKVT